MNSSISGQLSGLGIANQIIKVGSVAARIELGRNLLKECWIDDSANCKDGVHALTNYQYEFDDNKGRFKDKPLHDWASDGADAFGYLAQALLLHAPKASASRPSRVSNSGGWMG